MVVKIAARVVFSDEVTGDRSVQWHDLVRLGLRLNDLEVVAWDYIGETVRMSEVHPKDGVPAAFSSD